MKSSQESLKAYRDNKNTMVRKRGLQKEKLKLQGG